MDLSFAASPRSSLGIEWELACVDRRSGELVPAAPALLDAVGRRPSDEFPQATSEFLTNTVEVVSAPHARVADSIADLSAVIERLRTAAEPGGVELMCAGSHPFGQWFRQHVTPGKPRYDTLLDRTQWWGRQMMIWGVHVHVGIEDRDKVIPILNGLLHYVAHFQALSASSPYWAGENTGYASNRALVFQQLPTAGLPPHVDDWAQYESLVGDLMRTGVISELKEMHWDIRPSPRWGTVEIRTFDGVPTVREVGAIAALTQCLVEELSRRLDDGLEIAPMQPWFVRENKWRAARYGLDAIIIRNAAGDESAVTDDVRELVTRLAPIAEQLGCSDELQAVTGILEDGASYQRQLAVAAENNGSLKAVVASLVAELREGA